MRYRLWCVIIVAFAAVSCSGEGASGYKYKSVKVDTANLFFSGVYYSIDGNVQFKDCVTSRIINFQSPKINDINRLYSTMPKDKHIFCSFKGSYNGNNNVVTALNFIGFNITETCFPIGLNRVYAAQGDTLTLDENYRYSFKTNGFKTTQGAWGRTYKDSGVLMPGDGNGIEFTINEGNEDNNNNLFLSLEGANGKGVVFLPIKIN